LPEGEVNKAVIRNLFGPDVTHTDGNNVLRILQHRRTSGSLADYGVNNLGHRYTGITRDSAAKALEWLREKYPVDEARAAEEWAEKEANRIAYELWLADPENADSKYNDPARVWREQQNEIEGINEPESGKIGILRTGPSEFEKNIERKRRQRLEEMARKAEEKERKEKEDEAKLASGEWVRTPGGTALMKPGQTTYVDVFGREQISQRKEVMEYYQKKAESPFKDEEDMLKASTLVSNHLPTPFIQTIYLSN
jgi:rhomboid-like protein